MEEINYKIEENYKAEAKALYKKYNRKYIYLTERDIENILKTIDYYESWEVECDLEDRLRRKNNINEMYDSWDE